MAEQRTPRMDFDVVVVGAGMAGLVAARTLSIGGASVCVIEASDTPGGALRSADLAGVHVDVGAEAFAVTRPEARRLIEELGLEDSIIQPRRSDAHILLSTGIFAMPHGMLGIPTDLKSDEVVAIIGQAASKAALAKDSQPVARDLDPQITIGQLVRDRMGDEVVRSILSPVVGGVHAVDPDLVEADALIPGLLTAFTAQGSLAGAARMLRAASGTPGSAVAGLHGGMTTLVTALVADLGERGVEIRTGHPATVLEHSTDGWTVTANGEIVRATSLVMALDAPTASRLLATDTTDVGERLARVSVGDVAVVSAVFDSSQVDDDPVGSGVLIPPGHPTVRAKAMTHASAKWDWVREAYGPGRHLVRLSYGRNGVIGEDLRDLPEIAHRDIQGILGIEVPELIASRVTRWPSSLVHQRVGHRLNVAAIRAATDRHPDLAIVGAGIGGNGLAGTIAQARTAVTQLSGSRGRA
jgi:oxygen-dependent protoporphyrinogen oxidase